MELQVKALASGLAKWRLSLRLTEAAKDWLAERGYDPTYGARPLKRLIRAIKEAAAVEGGHHPDGARPP